MQRYGRIDSLVHVQCADVGTESQAVQPRAHKDQLPHAEYKHSLVRTHLIGAAAWQPVAHLARLTALSMRLAALSATFLLFHVHA